MPCFLKRLIADTTGATLPMIAAALIPIMLMLGAALDISVAYMAREKLQNACDAAVLAGRQSMQGTLWTAQDEAEANKFFDFNFPAGAHGAYDVSFDIQQGTENRSELKAVASATVPTAIMKVFGYKKIDLNVLCDATRDMGHNDIVLVLDVTGSMNDAPSNGAGTKIERLREGAVGLYRALDDDQGSITRYGFVPYSHTVNVGRSLRNRDILRDQPMVDQDWNCYASWCTYPKWVHINQSSWNSGNTNGNGGGGGSANGNTEGFRTSGDACIEERPSIGNDLDPFEIDETITLADVDTVIGNAGNQPELQFGRYDPAKHTNNGTARSGGINFYRIGGSWVQTGCPAEASKLRTYDDEDSYSAAVDTATARVTGGTYHDVGMLWGTRFISRNGFFASENPEDWDGIPINKHIVFMTDGKLDTGSTLYSAHGIERFQGRTQGWGGLNSRHINRFDSVCEVAKGMGITIWVIALDVTDTGDIESCATSPSQFYTSDGSDLEDIFERIGQGIGNLRLTK